MKKLTVLNRTWAKGKKWFRDALAENEEIEKVTSEDSGIYANAATRHKKFDASAEQRAREEIAEKLGKYFEILACAAIVKAETMDSHATIIATLSSTNAELVATNTRLVAQLATALGQQSKAIPPPPGYLPSNRTPPPTTGHAMTTAGVAAPTKYNPETRKNYFVTKHPCSHCNSKGVTHIPVNCLYNPVMYP